MFELFANPANMVLGAALISSPIIIHLINRMRYRRVRWAAMEFLLKSQKRSQKRLIIQQLLLLLLRILLVLLAALLLARFIGSTLGQGLASAPTTYFVVLDDRLSMSDVEKNDQQLNAFEKAKELILSSVVRHAQTAKTAPRVVVRLLSEPSNKLFDQRLNDASLSELRGVLGGLQHTSQQHLDLTDGINEAVKVFDASVPNENRVFWIVSDFRQRHWFQPENTAVLRGLRKLKNGNVEIQMLDAADGDPPRAKIKPEESPSYHGNVAVTDLRPETRVAAFNARVQFRVRITNFAAEDAEPAKGVRVSVKVDGDEKNEASQTIPSIKPGEVIEKSFELSFRDESKDGPDGEKKPDGEKEKKSEKIFKTVTAQIEGDALVQGVPGDNIRYAVIEIRKEIPVLVIDGDPNGEQPGGDTFHLRKVLNAASGYKVDTGELAALEAGDLKKYACVYMLNVPELDNKKQLENLEDYVREGGGVAFFMGDRITSSDYYNKELYKEGKGLYPAPLAEQPTRQLTDEEIRLRAELNRNDPRRQFFIRAEDHPMFRFEMDDLQNEGMRKRLLIDSENLTLLRHHPVQQNKWQRTEEVTEVLSLPKDGSVTDFVASVQDLLRALPVDKSEYKKDREALQERIGVIRDQLAGNSLHKLATSVEELLKAPALVGFWESRDAEIVKLKKQAETLRDGMQLGDPLLITKNFGRGRVAAVMTSAGRNWHNFPTMYTFPVMMLGIQRYLTSLGRDADYLVGQTKLFEEDSTRYESTLDYYRVADEPKAENPKVDEGDLTAKEAEGGRLVFTFDEAKVPGIYVFDFKRRAVGNEAAAVEKRALAFNVDTANESDLRRVTSKALTDTAVGIVIVNPTAAPPRPTAQDMSESPWFYLIFLIILVAEQALAVHLSFHLRSDQAAAAPPQAVQPQPTV